MLAICKFESSDLEVFLSSSLNPCAVLVTFVIAFTLVLLSHPPFTANNFLLPSCWPRAVAPSTLN